MSMKTQADTNHFCCGSSFLAPLLRDLAHLVPKCALGIILDQMPIPEAISTTMLLQVFTGSGPRHR